MNLKHTLATGFLTVVAFATLTFMPASADSLDAAPKAGSNEVILALNSAETPQHLVWDMTYGDHDLPVTAAKTTAVAADDDNVADLSLG